MLSNKKFELTLLLICIDHVKMIIWRIIYFECGMKEPFFLKTPYRFCSFSAVWTPSSCNVLVRKIFESIIISTDTTTRSRREIHANACDGWSSKCNFDRSFQKFCSRVKSEQEMLIILGIIRWRARRVDNTYNKRKLSSMLISDWYKTKIKSVFPLHHSERSEKPPKATTMWKIGLCSLFWFFASPCIWIELAKLVNMGFEVTNSVLNYV